MFLKSNEDSFVHLEKLLTSATEIKKFVNLLRTKFGLDADADIWKVYSAIESFYVENVRIVSELSSLKEDSRYSQSTYNSLLAELMEKEISANVANYMLFEITSNLNVLLNSKDEFVGENEYLNYMTHALSKIVSLDVLKRKDVVSEQVEELTRLKNSLERKIEEYTNLKIRIAEMFFPTCIPDLSTFDKDFSEFQKKYLEISTKAAKYDFLITRGAIKEVGNSISCNASFYLNYVK